MTRRRAAVRLLLSLTVALGVAGCTGDSGDDEPAGPDPQDSLTALASGLTAKDLSKVPFTEATATTAQASYDALAGQLADVDRVVETGDVEVSKGGEEAAGTLHWTWDLGSASWEYDAPVELALPA